MARKSFRSLTSEQATDSVAERRSSIGSNFLLFSRERRSFQTSSDALIGFDFARQNSSMSGNSLKRLSLAEQFDTPLLAGEGKRPSVIDALLNTTTPPVVQEKPARVHKKISGKKAARVSCHCRASKCLKLYCECFAKKQSCGPACHCTECFNTEKMSELREIVLKNTVEKNPSAFKAKYKAIEGKDAVLHVRGCNCTKTACQKNYCECFRAKIGCSQLCRCKNCGNGSLKMSESEVAQYYEKVVRKRRKKTVLSEELLQKYSALAREAAV